MAKRRTIELPEPEVETDDESNAQFYPQFEELAKRLGHLAKLEQQYIDLQSAFSVSFVSAFMAEQPLYALGPDRYGVSRSGWTYHTALAILQTCKMMDLVCKFETLGKRDAVIETHADPPKVILVAEWEWEFEDIFGSGKELDKLQASCQKHSEMEAFLLTYCPTTLYPEFVQRVAEYWIESTGKQVNPPNLFLHTVLFDNKGGIRQFSRLRTAQLRVGQILFWNDQLFGEERTD